MHSVELGPVAPADQTQRPLDLFLIFVGANIVATTLQIGASLPGIALGPALGVIAAGSIGGALLVALLAPVGSRLRVPSIVAARAALGLHGAQVVAGILFLTNFVWIALNNVIAASIVSRLAGAPAQAGACAVALGLVATVIVLGGPKTVGAADRFAVPLLGVSGVVVTIACLRANSPVPSASAAVPTAGGLLRGFDVVFGYQTSWLLMFGDYSRYTRDGRQAFAAVFWGLALTALWFIPLGLVASTVAGSPDPGVMVQRLGLGWWGGTLVVLATLTTNFVNIYMSALAVKSLRPTTGDATAVWTIGGLGAGISILSSTWLDQMATFTLLLAGLFVPVGGLLLAHFVIGRHGDEPADLYRGPDGTPPGVGAWSLAGMLAWIVGAVTFYVAQPIGGVTPSLCASIATYLLIRGRRSTTPSRVPPL
ncbi:MAG: cytosine permease [Acidobacteria bacterium]|nr:cytosine permease [Acidobacteriota bacterium]